MPPPSSSSCFALAFLLLSLLAPSCLLPPPWLHQHHHYCHALRIHGKKQQEEAAPGGGGGSIKGPIKTIVVLVMENRSFDHMLGWMKKLIPELEGVTGEESNPASFSADGSGAGSAAVRFTDGAEFVDPDPGHSYGAIGEQVYGRGWAGERPAEGAKPTMDGFAAQAASAVRGGAGPGVVMAGFRPESVPVYAALAQEFAALDRWFASVPSSTQPNRLFVHSGTSHGAVANDPALLAAGLPQRTVFDDLHDAGLSFSVYYRDAPTVLFYRSLRQLKYAESFKPFDLRFDRDAASGQLPNYAVVEPRYFDLPGAGAPADDDHPSHDVARGQALVKRVYEALRAGPRWNRTLLLLTYDEHGGFFDHVPTPASGVPSPDGLVSRPPFNFTFQRLGVRVPALAISPWINKATVVHAPDGPTPTSQFEHSSIPATVRKLFNLPSPPLTAREAWAGSLDGLVYQRTSPRTDCPEQLPSPPWSLRHSAPDGERPMSEFQQELVQLSAALMRQPAHALASVAAELKSVARGHEFVKAAMDKFFEAGKAALEQGLDGNTVIHI